MDVSIVIVNFNSSNLLAKTITEAKRSFYSHKLKHEIIVIDNFSTLLERKILCQIKIRLKFKLFLTKNLGFGFACNLGAKKATGKVLIFLNPDCFTLSHALPLLTLKVLANRNTIFGPQLLNLDGTPQPSAGPFLTLPSLLVFLFAGGEYFNITKYAPNYTCDVDWVSAACFAINRTAFMRLQGFDTNIFLYAEDMELMYRAKKNNIRTLYYPSARFTHVGSATQDKKLSLFYLYKGIIDFNKKHFSHQILKIIISLLFIKANLVLFYASIVNNHTLRVKYKYALKALT